MSESKLPTFIIGFVLGAAVGAGLALLLAPAPGQETRRRLRSRGLELADQGRQTAQKALARSQEVAEHGRAKLTSTVEKVKSRLQPEKPLEEPPSGEEGASSPEATLE